MIKLTVGNSYSRIENLTDPQRKELKDLLSYTINPQAAYFSGSFRTKRSLLGKRGDFPTGLLYIVEKWLIKLEQNHAIHDTRNLPEPLLGLFKARLDLTPYPEQEEAATACLKRHRGIVTAPTGTGKSVMAALIIQALQVPTLVVVPTLELKRQLLDSLKTIFTSLKVGDMNDGRSIVVENVDALDYNRKLEGYDCVIIDEFHHSASKTYRLLNRKSWTDVYYRFGLTATPFRSQDNERLLLESVLSEVIYKIDYKTAVDKGYIVPLEAYYMEVPKTFTDGYSWQEVYSDLVVNNEVRNKIIKDLMHVLQGQHVLTLVKEIKHGEWLRSISGTLFSNGQDYDSRSLISQFANGNLKSLIGTTGVLGEGIDTKAAEWIIIAGLGKSKNAFMQQVGRGFRRYPGKESCKVMIFKDSSHKWTLNHFKAQCMILKEEYGIKPIKLELP